MNFMENLLTYTDRKRDQIDHAIDRREFEKLKELTCGESENEV